MRKAGVLGAAIVGLLFMSCSKGEDVGSQDSNTSNEMAVKAAFTTQFPSAANVSWGKVQEFDVAKFILPSKLKSTSGGSHSCAAWYKGNGKWEMTEVEFTFDQLSDTIKKAFTASEYGDGTWTTVKIVQLKKSDGTEFYKFEVKKSGENNRLLYFKADGTLAKVKEVSSQYPDCGNYPTVVPTEIQAYITANYPNATVKEVMKSFWGYWVEVKDGAIERNLFFSPTYELIMQMSKLALADMPKAVQDAFQASTYATWTVKSIENFEFKGMPSYYILKVRLDKKKATLVYTADGKLVQEQASKYPF